MISNQRFWLTNQSKGDHKKGLDTPEIKKTKRKETFCIFPKANQQTVLSPFLCKKEEEGNLFDFNDMRIELACFGNPIIYDSREED